MAVVKIDDKLSADYIAEQQSTVDAKTAEHEKLLKDIESVLAEIEKARDNIAAAQKLET